MHKTCTTAFFIISYIIIIAKLVSSKKRKQKIKDSNFSGDKTRQHGVSNPISIMENGVSRKMFRLLELTTIKTSIELIIKLNYETRKYKDQEEHNVNFIQV